MNSNGCSGLKFWTELTKNSFWCCVCFLVTFSINVFNVFPQDGIGGQSIRGGAELCIASGLHHCWSLWGSKVTKCVSLRITSLLHLQKIHFKTEVRHICFPVAYNFYFVALRDPDNVVLCLLATDDEEDVALQIHFTLIQAFCCENDINILRVSNMRRLAEILGGVKPGGEPMDLHCVLVTVSVITQTCLL